MFVKFKFDLSICFITPQILIVIELNALKSLITPKYINLICEIIYFLFSIQNMQTEIFACLQNLTKIKIDR